MNGPKIRPILNATPHDVTILYSIFRDEWAEQVTFPRCGYEIRANAKTAQPASIEHPAGGSAWVACVERREWNGLTNADRPEQGAAVIVSIVAAPLMAQERPDCLILVPDTGPDSVVRYESGQIRGVQRLIVWHRPESTTIVDAVRITHPRMASILDECVIIDATEHDGCVIMNATEHEDAPFEADLVDRNNMSSGFAGFGPTPAYAIIELNAYLWNCGQDGFRPGDRIRITNPRAASEA